ncbi:MAG: peptidase M64 [Alloprevotella sp.]|nr:peptidase M64 [Alloprevotella sp.]
MRFHRVTLGVLFLLPSLFSALKAQDFSTYFLDKTLRLDFVFAGNSAEQHIFYAGAKKYEGWAGRRGHLSDILLRGNGQLLVRDHTSQQLIYTHTFSTLFQEWVATEEATRSSQSFEATFQIPFPKEPVDITVSLLDIHGKEKTTYSQTIDPSDILIRPVESRKLLSNQLLRQGSVQECVDVVIISEGYKEDEYVKFSKDAERACEALFAHEPFKSLRTRFNIQAVFAPSQDSGPSIPHDNIWHETACQSHFDTFYTDRYLTTSSLFQLHDLLAGLPYEHIIVLANTGTYGGGGIYNQLTLTTSDHRTFSQVLVHEFGHAYAGLADEYFYDDQFSSIYPADTEPWEPNLTTLVDFKSKWADLLSEATPVPTPPSDIPDYRTAKTKKEWKAINESVHRIGVFEGGGYQSKGVFRPAQECRMKINEVTDFCPVCTRAIRRVTDFYTEK